MYALRIKVEGTFVMVAELDDNLVKEIVFSTLGEWTTFNGKRAFRIGEDMVFGNRLRMKVFLWKDSLLVKTG